MSGGLRENKKTWLILVFVLFLIASMLVGLHIILQRHNNDNLLDIGQSTRPESMKFGSSKVTFLVPLADDPELEVSRRQTLHETSLFIDLPRNYGLVARNNVNLDYQDNTDTRLLETFAKNGRTYYILEYGIFGSEASQNITLSSCGDRFCSLRLAGNEALSVELWKNVPKDEYKCCANPAEPINLDDPYLYTLLSVLKSIEIEDLSE